VKKKLKKLIAEYKEKISNCDRLIKNYTQLKRDAEFFEDKRQVEVATTELTINNTKKQAYKQTKEDLNTLIDHLKK